LTCCTYQVYSFLFVWTKVGFYNGNRDKCQKHGVSVEEIEYVLRSEDSLTIDDIQHSEIEKRYIIFGRTAEKRWVFVAYTFRAAKGIILIRPISARYMHDREVKNYGQ